MLHRISAGKPSAGKPSALFVLSAEANEKKRKSDVNDDHKNRQLMIDAASNHHRL